MNAKSQKDPDHRRGPAEPDVDHGVQPPSRLRAVSDSDAPPRAADARTRQRPLSDLADPQREVFWAFDVTAQRFRDVSPAFEVVWGRPVAELEAEPSVLLEGVSREDRPLVLAALERQAAGECTELRYRVTRPDGTTRWVWDRAFPVHDQAGNLVRILALAVDVTDEREAEPHAPRDDRAARAAAAEQAARARDEFLSAMSHELRTPLNAVLGACEALREGLYGQLTEPQRGAVGRVEEGGKRLLSVVDAVLDFSNLAAGGVDLARAPSPIDELCRSALGNVRDGARRKQLRVSFEVTDGFSTIDVDAARFVQVLVALLRNAVKFTPEGGAIGIEAGVDQGQKRAYFTVWDEGIGIPQAEISRLFRPFVQVDAGLARQHGGAGLGLAIARRLVDMHGGELRVESQPAKGSRFTVEMPLQARPAR